MSFISSHQQWLESHFVTAAGKIAAALGDLGGKRILSVGCGEMLIEFGLLAHNALHITGLDIVPQGANSNVAIAKKLTDAGFGVDPEFASKIDFVQYDGEHFPFEDSSFDAVFSWGAFEHFSNVRAVLTEMRRIMKADARGVITVFPWFPCFYGSHLSDYIEKPFFQLTESKEWVKARLEEYAEKNPSARDLVTRHMWQEFNSLNRYSSNDFYQDFRAVDFGQHSWELLSYPLDLTRAPAGANFGDLMIAGSQVSFGK